MPATPLALKGPTSSASRSRRAGHPFTPIFGAPKFLAATVAVRSAVRGMLTRRRHPRTLYSISHHAHWDADNSTVSETLRGSLGDTLRYTIGTYGAEERTERMAQTEQTRAEQTERMAQTERTEQTRAEQSSRRFSESSVVLFS